jgi:thymidylate kinase
MQKTIIAVRGIHDSGKTTSIGLAYKKLEKEGTVIVAPRESRETRSAVLEIDGVKVGFWSVGDVEELLEEGVDPLIDAGCAVIVCAARSRGGTVEYVKSLESQFKIV